MEKAADYYSLFDLQFQSPWEKGGKKNNYESISYFWIEVFLKEVLGLLHYEGTTFIPNLSS